MDYKEKYEKAYKLLEQMHDGGIVSKIDIENIFPELKKKSVINMLKIAVANTAWLDCDKNKCLFWLEKQGCDTNETIDRDKFAQGVLRGAAINLITWIDYNAAEGNMCLSNMECKDIEDALVSGNWDKIYAYIKKKLERQGEKQDYNLYKTTIESISAMVEKYANGDLRDFYDNIKVKCKDAIEYDNTWNKKQGKQKLINSYCQDNCKGFQETGKCYTDGECKAKRDAEQKLAWSEEDELMLTSTVNTLKLTNGSAQMKIEWLKSLKERMKGEYNYDK